MGSSVDATKSALETTLSITIVGDPAVYVRLIGRALDEGADLKAAETIAAALAQPAQIVAEAQRVMAPCLEKLSVYWSSRRRRCSAAPRRDRQHCRTCRPNTARPYRETSSRQARWATAVRPRSMSQRRGIGRHRVQPRPESPARGHVGLAALLVLAARRGGHRPAQHAVRLEVAPTTTLTLKT